MLRRLDRDKEDSKKYRKKTARFITEVGSGYKEIVIGVRFRKQVPKTARLRKKKMWWYCGKCKNWFHRMAGTNGKLENGTRLCKTCLRKHVETYYLKKNSSKVE